MNRERKNKIYPDKNKRSGGESVKNPRTLHPYAPATEPTFLALSPAAISRPTSTSHTSQGQTNHPELEHLRPFPVHWLGVEEPTIIDFTLPVNWWISQPKSQNQSNPQTPSTQSFSQYALPPYEGSSTLNEKIVYDYNYYINGGASSPSNTETSTTPQSSSPTGPSGSSSSSTNTQATTLAFFGGVRPYTPPGKAFPYIPEAFGLTPPNTGGNTGESSTSTSTQTTTPPYPTPLPHPLPHIGGGIFMVPSIGSQEGGSTLNEGPPVHPTPLPHPIVIPKVWHPISSPWHPTQVERPIFAPAVERKSMVPTNTLSMNPVIPKQPPVHHEVFREPMIL